MAEDGPSGEDCVSLSNEIYDKLHILNYSKELVKNKGNKPLIPDYFAFSINQNEQFGYFKSLIKWLFECNNVTESDFSSYEDPNTIAMSIQSEMRKMNINIDISGIKLKNGYGMHLCEILLALINRTLKAKKVTLGQPRFPANDAMGDKAEMDMDDEEDEGIDMDDNLICNDDDDEEMGMLDMIGTEKAAIQPRAEEKEWILECQRVRSKLEQNIIADHKEWRNHIEKAKGFSDNLKKSEPSTTINLERLSDRIGQQLERILSKENQINKAMSDIGEEFKVKNEKNKEINETIANLTARVKESSDEYQRYCEKYEKLKVRLDDYENTATNDEPLIKLKKACADLKGEIKNMDVRIGVLNHIVMKMAHNKKKEIIESALNRGGYNKMADAIIIENPDMEEDLDEHN